jgi:hypothetical protein
MQSHDELRDLYRELILEVRAISANWRARHILPKASILYAVTSSRCISR